MRDAHGHHASNLVNEKKKHTKKLKQNVNMMRMKELLDETVKP